MQLSKKYISIVSVTIIIIISGIYLINLYQQSPNKPVVNKSVRQKALVFNGEGRKLLGPINLVPGLALLTAKNQTGQNDNFSVNIYADDNNDGIHQAGETWLNSNIGVAYETAESYNGTVAFKADKKGYFIDVEGGRWQINITQPEKLTTPAPAKNSFSGQGTQVTEKFFLATGDHFFHTTNTGDANFIIYLVDEAGNFTSRLVNKVGPYDGDFSVKIVFAGNYVFAINDDKAWTITYTPQ